MIAYQYLKELIKESFSLVACPDHNTVIELDALFGAGETNGLESLHLWDIPETVIDLPSRDLSITS